MNSKLYRRSNNHAITACAVLLAASMNVYSWSVSGTVKDKSNGAALSGVAVTVKDSTKYSTTTDASGNFKLESTVSVIKSHSIAIGTYSLNVKNNELFITVPQNGMLELAMFNCSGRSIWSSKVTTAANSAKLQLPSTLSQTAVYLQVKQANTTTIHSLAWTTDGLHIGPASGALQSINKVTAAAMANPTLEFKKTDFRDTSFSMTSETMTNVAVVMASGSTQTCALPSSTSTLNWQSSDILVNIHNDSKHSIVAVKDPTIQKYNGKYLIYCTVATPSTNNWNMQFIQFTDFAQADAAPVTFMDQIPGFSGYKCAPELFYFEPQKLWYLIFQTQAPQYSTTTTPDKPDSWSTPKNLTNNWSAWEQAVPSDTKAIDYFPIADDSNMYLFMTGDNGKVYRSKTTLAQFPNGFSTPTVVKQLNGTGVIFEGGSHYKIKGTTNTYLHVVEGIGSARYFSAWTSTGIEGEWIDYKVGQNNPFIHSSNTTYPSGGDWTDDISHGEFIRDNPNQYQELDPCDLRFLYQGKNPADHSGDCSNCYIKHPYRLGLVTLQK